MQFSPEYAIGWSRLLLVGGVLGLAAGRYAGWTGAAWAGLAVVAAAFALNTAGKLAHFRSLSLPGAARAKLAVSWVALAAVVVAFLAVLVDSRFGTGTAPEDAFWPLAIAGFGLALVYRGFQRTHLENEEA